MGQQVRVTKMRVCKSCNETLYMDAERLKYHADLCTRAKKFGLILVMPEIVQPKVELVKLE